MICATRSGSQSASATVAGEAQLEVRLVGRERRRELAATPRAISRRSVRSGRSSSDPASSRERSRRSVARRPRRATCSRTWRMNITRVSSSSSSSSSSSRNPPIEKIGVRSSCEAVAMKRLRAVSSSASWRCIPSSVAREPAELVAGGDVEARGEVALRRPGARRAPSAPPGARASARTSTLARIASASAIPPATRIRCRMSSTPRWMPSSGCENDRDVVDARALRAWRGDPQRDGGLGHPAGVARLGAALDPAGERGALGDAELQVGDARRGVRVRAHLEAHAAAVGALDGQERDARARVVVGARAPGCRGRWRGTEASSALRIPGPYRSRRLRERVEPLVAKARLERWRDREVDDRDRRDDDRAEREGEAEGEAAQRCYASVSRNR